ncbi:helix-turn-helix domain-containing protein [Paenibacillus harenae]|uniref:helix-turn-helix domain-containing protein n=1 Tax=Paenibacillus harenae TaxID=306543 RepID=UPI0027945D2C|nr:helix-turn-helix transcriptional regulator [Paenibacillus harenae]MDQ0062329.1 transcriptional regulator with XRE-family HTH domain [Paenibacillus harenae]
MASLGSRIAYLRNKKGISQEEFSKVLKIGKSTLGMYETDKREPSHEMAAKIAKEFDVTLDWLLTGNEKESEYTLPESEYERVIREAEAHYGVNLRDNTVVNATLRELILGIAKSMKSGQ